MRNKIMPLVTLLLMAALLLTTSCKTSRKGATSRGQANLEMMQRVEEVLKVENPPQSYSAKVDVTIKTGGTNLSSKGDLRIVRGEAIYLSLQPFLGIELFRVVVTPDRLLIIDRSHKRYISQPLASLRLLDYAVDPYSLIESLFLNRLFVVGKSEASSGDFERFTFAKQDDGGLSLEKSVLDKASYAFLIDRGNLLTKTTVSVPSSNLILNWSYANFMSEGGYTQPLQSIIDAKMGVKQLTLQIEAPRIDFDKKMTIDKAAPSRYNEVKLDALIKSLIK